MPSYTFTFKCVDADGREALLTDTVEVNDPPTVETITLNPRTITASAETSAGIPLTVAASLTLGADLRLTTSDGFASAVEWAVNATAADFEAYMTPLDGATFDGPEAETWHNLGTDLTWSSSYTTATAGTRSTQFFLVIREVATSVVRATAAFTFDLQMTVLPPSVRLSDQTFTTEATGLDPSPVYNFNSISLWSDGRLSGYVNNLLTYIPNEWGPGQDAGAFEARFTLQSLHPMHRVAFGTVFGVWNTLALSPGYSLDMEFTGNGEYDTSSIVFVEIRPVGGAVIASATHTIRMSGYRYPSGSIP